MKIFKFFLGLLLCLCMSICTKPSTCSTAEIPPMVTKHIFLESPPSEEDAVSTDEANLLNSRLDFTGIIITDRGKYALIQPQKKKRGEKVKSVYEPGESIAGYELKDISNNYIILSKNETDIKLRLYSAGKSRPAEIQRPKIIFKPPEPPSNDSQANEQENAKKPEKTENQEKNPKADPGKKSMTDKTNTERNTENTSQTSQSAGDLLRKAMEGKSSNTGSAPSGNAAAAFLEAIKKATQ